MYHLWPYVVAAHACAATALLVYLRKLRTQCSSKRELSAFDSFWYRVHTEENPMVINGLLLADGDCKTWTPERLRELLVERFLPHQRFRSRVDPPANCMGLPTWVEDPAFSLDKHFIVHELKDSTEETLVEFINTEISTALDFSIPLWKLILIRGGPGGPRLMLRIHHCIADGVGLTTLFSSLADDGKDLEKEMKEKLKRFGGAKKPKPGLAMQLKELLLFVGLCFYGVAKITLFQPDSPSPFKAPISGKKRTAYTDRLSLDEITKVGKYTDSSNTVNDILSTIIAGALRMYCQEAGLQPDSMGVRCVMPVNIRPPHIIPKLENQFSIWYKSLPIHIPSGVGRLSNFHQRMSYMKKGIEAMLGTFLVKLIAFFPRWLFHAIINHYTRRGSCVTTNVPGPADPVRFCGAPVDNVVFWVPSCGSVCLGISFFTYRGRVTIGVISDANGADPHRLVDCIHKEWEALKAEVATLKIKETPPTARRQDASS